MYYIIVGKLCQELFSNIFKLFFNQFLDSFINCGHYIILRLICQELFLNFLIFFLFYYQMFCTLTDCRYYIKLQIKCQELFSEFPKIISFNVLGVQPIYGSAAPTLYATAGGQSVYPFMVLSLK